MTGGIHGWVGTKVIDNELREGEVIGDTNGFIRILTIKFSEQDIHDFIFDNFGIDPLDKRGIQWEFNEGKWAYLSQQHHHPNGKLCTGLCRYDLRKKNPENRTKLWIDIDNLAVQIWDKYDRMKKMEKDNLNGKNYPVLYLGKLDDVYQMIHEDIYGKPEYRKYWCGTTTRDQLIKVRFFLKRIYKEGLR